MKSPPGPAARGCRCSRRGAPPGRPAARGTTAGRPGRGAGRRQGLQTKGGGVSQDARTRRGRERTVGRRAGTDVAKQPPHAAVDRVVRVVLEAELEVGEVVGRVDLGHGGGGVGLGAHGAGPAPAVVEVAREAVRLVLGLGVGRPQGLGGPVDEAAPPAAVGRRLEDGVAAAAVAADARLGVPEVGAGGVGGVARPVPVRHRARPPARLQLPLVQVREVAVPRQERGHVVDTVREVAVHVREVVVQRRREPEARRLARQAVDRREVLLPRRRVQGPELDSLRRLRAGRARRLGHRGCRGEAGEGQNVGETHIEAKRGAERVIWGVYGDDNVTSERESVGWQ